MSKRFQTSAHLYTILISKQTYLRPFNTNKDRIKENWEIFDFELTNDEMKEIELLDCDCSLFSWYE